MHKFLLTTLLAISTTSFCHDPIQEAILESDYAAFSKQYTASEIPENLQQAYWSIAADTAKMRSSNLAFDWAKAFISKKLLISALLVNFFWAGLDQSYKNLKMREFNPAGFQRQFPDENPDAAIVGCLALFLASSSAFLWALIDGNKYYHQLKEKIKDAERIKFLIIAQS